MPTVGLVTANGILAEVRSAARRVAVPLRSRRCHIGRAPAGFLSAQRCPVERRLSDRSGRPRRSSKARRVRPADAARAPELARPRRGSRPDAQARKQTPPNRCLHNMQQSCPNSQARQDSVGLIADLIPRRSDAYRRTRCRDRRCRPPRPRRIVEARPTPTRAPSSSPTATGTSHATITLERSLPTQRPSPAAMRPACLAQASPIEESRRAPGRLTSHSKASRTPAAEQTRNTTSRRSRPRARFCGAVSLTQHHRHRTGKPERQTACIPSGGQ